MLLLAAIMKGIPLVEDLPEPPFRAICIKDAELEACGKHPTLTGKDYGFVGKAAKDIYVHDYLGSGDIVDQHKWVKKNFGAGLIKMISDVASIFVIASRS
ncbi:hypothetical protein C5167_017483 [Papaver somniferum]|uniref:Uncharacterized protein n=1 Tax=Papaver somniferum TaxID=3469 RepID=A0A4Y7IJJ1_PAPSO|nr:hypothetical protein C5167_017483 [Papaver somniferum]